MQFNQFSFGSIRIDGLNYRHDVEMDRAKSSGPAGGFEHSVLTPSPGHWSLRAGAFCIVNEWVA